MLPEDKDERRMFNDQAKLHGGPLEAIASVLAVWARMPSAVGNRGFNGQCAVMANEALRAAKRDRRRALSERMKQR